MTLTNKTGNVVEENVSSELGDISLLLEMRAYYSDGGSVLFISYNEHKFNTLE